MRSVFARILVAIVMASAALVLAAPPSSALNLVSVPATQVKLHGSIKIGVWYREWEGGPRAFRVRVINPAGQTIFFRQGRAPNQWRNWRVYLHRTGRFRTVYHTKNFQGEWLRSSFPTRVVR